MFGWLKEILGIREKTGRETPEEIVQHDVQAQQPSLVAPIAGLDAFTLLEEEKFDGDLRADLIGFLSRDLKLANLNENEIEMLHWEREKLLTLLQIKYFSLMPPPDRYVSARDYARMATSVPVLLTNINVELISVISRAKRGFTALLVTGRPVIIGR